MENSPCTDDEIELFRKLKAEFPGNVGLAVQAYLRRTKNDLEQMLNINDSEIPISYRLCKGIYNEPREIAYKDMAIINRSFVCCLERMFEKGAYVGIATHDGRSLPAAVNAAVGHGTQGKPLW